MKPKMSSNPVAKFSKRFNKAAVHKPKRGRGSYTRVQGRQYNTMEDEVFHGALTELKVDEDFYNELYERNDSEDGS